MSSTPAQTMDPTEFVKIIALEANRAGARGFRMSIFNGLVEHISKSLKANGVSNLYTTSVEEEVRSALNSFFQLEYNPFRWNGVDTKVQLEVKLDGVVIDYV